VSVLAPYEVSNILASHAGYGWIDQGKGRFLDLGLWVWSTYARTEYCLAELYVTFRHAIINLCRSAWLTARSRAGGG